MGRSIRRPATIALAGLAWLAPLVYLGAHTGAVDAVVVDRSAYYGPESAGRRPSYEPVLAARVSRCRGFVYTAGALGHTDVDRHRIGARYPMRFIPALAPRRYEHITDRPPYPTLTHAFVGSSLLEFDKIHFLIPAAIAVGWLIALVLGRLGHTREAISEAQFFLIASVACVVVGVFTAGSVIGGRVPAVLSLALAAPVGALIGGWMAVKQPRGRALIGHTLAALAVAIAVSIGVVAATAAVAPADSPPCQKAG